jgi:hypothetical protein
MTVAASTDACRGGDDGRASGHQLVDADTVHVLPIGDRVGNVRLCDDACRLTGLSVQDHQSSRARLFHQIGSRSHVILLCCRRQRWPHHVRGEEPAGQVTPLSAGRVEPRRGVCQPLPGAAVQLAAVRFGQADDGGDVPCSGVA